MRFFATASIVTVIAGVVFCMYMFLHERSQADLCVARGGVAVQGDNTVTCLDPDALLGVMR